MSNNRQLAKNMLYNVVTFGINLCINFFLTPYLIRSVGKEAYSFFPLVGNMVGYVHIITTAVGSMGGRFVTMAYYQNRHNDAQEYWNSTFFSNILLSASYSIIFIFACIYINNLLTIPGYLLHDVQWLFAFNALSLIVALITSNFASGCYLKNRLDLSASRQMVSSILNAISVVCLFYFFSPNIYYVGLSGLICAVFCAVFNFQLKQTLLPEIPIRPFTNHSWKKILEVTKSGMWNAVNHLSNILTSHLDLLISNIFISAAATGDFALVKVVPNFIYSFLGTITVAFAPNFNILYAKGEMKELVHEVKKSINIIGFIMCVPIGFFLIFADSFFRLWVPSEDYHYLYSLSFLSLLPCILAVTASPVYNIFTVTNHLKVPSLVLFFAGILMFVINYTLLSITNWGLWIIVGVSAVQLALRSFFFTLVYAAHCLKTSVWPFLLSVVKSIVGLLIACGFSFVVKRMVAIDGWIGFVFAFIFIALVAYTINVFVVLRREERSYLKAVVLSKLHIR